MLSLLIPGVSCSTLSRQLRKTSVMRPRLSILWRSHCRAGAAASRHASAACFAKSCPCMTACITALVCLPLPSSLSSAHAGRHPARTAYLLFPSLVHRRCSPCGGAARAAFSAISSVCTAFSPTSRPWIIIVLLFTRRGAARAFITYIYIIRYIFIDPRTRDPRTAPALSGLCGLSRSLHSRSRACLRTTV